MEKNAKAWSVDDNHIQREFVPFTCFSWCNLHSSMKNDKGETWCMCFLTHLLVEQHICKVTYIHVHICGSTLNRINMVIMTSAQNTRSDVMKLKVQLYHWLMWYPSVSIYEVGKPSLFFLFVFLHEMSMLLLGFRPSSGHLWMKAG